MKAALKSDIGRIRSVNEDRAAVQTLVNGLTLAVVADGMGGHQAGDVASQMAVDVIMDELKSIDHHLSAAQFQQKLSTAIEKANKKILNKSQEQEKYSGMGTTVVAAVVWNDYLIVAHIGDSRAYTFTEGQFVQLTDDHSLVNELVKRGQITPEEAESHPRKNVLTQALGTSEEINIDIKMQSWNRNDLLMLCSDGLTNMLTLHEMTKVLKEQRDLEWKLEQLIDQSLEAGGDDNITVILVANEQAVQAKGVE